MLREPLPSVTALFRRQEPAPRTPFPSASARGPAHQASPPPATRRVVVRLLRLHVASFSEGVLLPNLPRSRVKLDSAFPRNSGRRFTLFPVKEGSTRLAASSPFPSRLAGRKPSPVGTLLPPTRAPILKASTGSAGPLSPSPTLTHVRSAPPTTVERKQPDTARRVSGDSTISSQINQTIIPLNAEESQVSPSSTGSEPPAPLGLRQRPSGAARTPSGLFSRMSDGATRPGSMGPNSSRAPGPSVVRIVRCPPPNHHRWLGTVGL